jgi:putative DNA primase/helicase
MRDLGGLALAAVAQKQHSETYAAPYTDVWNANRLVARHGQDLRYCHAWKKWLAWDGKRWRQDDTGEVIRRAEEAVLSLYSEATQLDKDARKALLTHAQRSESRNRLDAMVALAQHKLPVRQEELDINPWLLNVENGTIDLRTGALGPHDRTHFITKLAPVAFDSGAECPTWELFVMKIMACRKPLVEYLQRGVGYSATGDVSEQNLFLPHGSGANGKSTFINTITGLLGDYAMLAAPDLLMMKRGERHPTELADLYKRRFVATIESDEGRRLTESLVKQLTGGDPIKARRMREDFWQFLPTHKLWLATNHKPAIRGTDHAIWRRIHLIPFDVRFNADSDNKPDPELPEKLKSEWPGILNWVVFGCLWWQHDRLNMPDEVRQATSEYRQESDLINPWLEDCCQVNPLAKSRAGDLYESYLKWCEQNGEKPIPQRTLGRRLSERGCTRQQSHGVRWWIGIGLTHEGTAMRYQSQAV